MFLSKYIFGIFDIFGSAGRAGPFKFTSGDYSGTCVQHRSLQRSSDRNRQVLVDVLTSEETITGRTTDVKRCQLTLRGVYKTSNDVTRRQKSGLRREDKDIRDDRKHSETSEDVKRHNLTITRRKPDADETKTRRGEMILVQKRGARPTSRPSRQVRAYTPFFASTFGLRFRQTFSRFWLQLWFHFGALFMFFASLFRAFYLHRTCIHCSSTIYILLRRLIV